MKRRATGVIATITVALLVIAAGGASAGDRGTRVMTKYDVTSNEVVGEQRFLTLAGSGHSAQLGPIEITSSAVATPLAGGCQTRAANETWTTPSGSLVVTTQGLLCGSGKLSGTWSVTGGSGAFANASGSGDMRGALVHQGIGLHVAYTGDVSP